MKEQLPETFTSPKESGEMNYDLELYIMADVG
jgi:hypothetical protein